MTQPWLIISYQRSQLFVLAQFVMNKSDRAHTLIGTEPERHFAD